MFKARLLKYVYTHKIKVTVFDQEILLEPDEERNYRVVRSETQMKQSVEVDLLKAIVNALNDHL